MMIKILSGQNQFLIDQFVTNLANQQGIEPTVVYADDEENLIDKIMARDLFRPRQILVVKNLLSQKQALEQIMPYFEQIMADQDLSLLIVEPKLDKRLKFVKLAQKEKLVEEFALLKDYDQAGAVNFMLSFAKSHQINLAREAAAKIWQLVGNDALAQTKVIEQLAVFEQEIDLMMVEKYVAPTLRVDSFLIVDQVFMGHEQKVSELVDQLEKTSLAPQMFWGLIVSQIINLVMVKNLDQTELKQLKIHPFVMRKLQKPVNRINDQQLKEIVTIIDQTDTKLKTLANQDWLLIKIALLKISRYFN